MKENWKDIPGYEGFYQASDQGRIKSYDKVVATGKCHTRIYKGRIKAQRLDSQKHYLITELSKDRKSKTILVHRIIASTFLGDCSGLDINHKDGVKTNNAITNLEVVTKSENEIHKYRVLKVKHPYVGRNGSMHAKSVPVLQINKNTNEVVKVYESARLAELDGYQSSNISLCCNGKQKEHKGFIWKFKQFS